MASWDDEDYDPDVANKSNQLIVADKWDGEDEDDDIKDNWDDDDDDDEKDKKETSVAQPKKKKPLTERIKEKEEKKRKEKMEREEERKRLEEENKKLTPEEQLAENLKNQRLQEESDLELAKDAFGIGETLPGQKTIDNFNPTSKEEFTELSSMISQKLTKYEHKSDYTNFLESLFRDCCAGVDAEDIKRISNTLNVLASEKLKLAKAVKGGKKKGAASKKSTLVSGKGTKNEMDYDDDYYNEYEDFM